MLHVIQNEPIVISLPDKEFLTAVDGFAMATDVIAPLQKALVHGPQKIVIAIPEDRPNCDARRGQRTISGSFFTGLFQNLLLDLRETHLPTLKYAAARCDMRAVDELAGDKPDFVDKLLNRLFKKAWNVYSPLETLFWQRVCVGLQLNNGELLKAQIIDADRYCDYPAGTHGRRLLGWNQQIVRGLDNAFSHDLKYDPALYDPVLVSRPVAPRLAPKEPTP